MKTLLLQVLSYSSALLLTGCLYGQCMEGPCSLEREKILKSIKPYGKQWVKPGADQDTWQQDWVTCGGDSNGQYGVYTPPGSTTEVVLAANKREAERLGVCMKSKGYEYRYTGIQ